MHHTKSFLSFYDQPFNLLSWSHFHITTPGNSGLYLVGRNDLFILRFHLVVLSAPAVDIGLLTMIAYLEKFLAADHLVSERGAVVIMIYLHYQALEADHERPLLSPLQHFHPICNDPIPEPSQRSHHRPIHFSCVIDV